MTTLRTKADTAASVVARALHMTLTKASGATTWSKTDAASKTSAMEHKYTESNSFKLSAELLKKLWRQANTFAARAPVFVITFALARDMPKDWVVIPLNEYIRLTEKTDET
jgi:hypothetical protein